VDAPRAESPSNPRPEQVGGLLGDSALGASEKTLDLAPLAGDDVRKMKRSRTTYSGRVAALALAASQTPHLPHWAGFTMAIVGAIAVAYLGHCASDCPPNCPGTYPDGTRRDDTNQLRFRTVGLVALAAGGLALAGCTAPNPAHQPGNTNAPAYIVSPQVAAWSNSLVPIAQTTGEVTGTGAAFPQAVAAGFGLVAAISAYIARRKSLAADTLAAAVHDQGPQAVADAMAYASDTPHYPAVAKALNAQCATGQAPGQPLPTPPQKGS
jgi:hypothetical protein